MKKENRIAIVNSSSFGKLFPEHIQRLKAIGDVKRLTVNSDITGKELAKKLNGFNMIIASITPFFTKEFFNHKDELKLISRHGIGYNNVDLDAARNHDTIVSIVPPLVERDAVAENNITNLLNVMRQTNMAHQHVLDDKWEERSKFVGHGLSGKTAGVIGVGNIGSRVVEILYYGFRCDVLAYDPYRSREGLEQFGAKKVELEDLLKNSDVICLCASLNEFNYHMLAEEQFAMMKDSVYLSNTARGALIKEEALINALEQGKVAGFATDVLEEEPGRANHPYLQFENVIITPHTSAYTMECLQGMGDKCVDDCEKVAEGKLPGRAIQKKSKYLK